MLNKERRASATARPKGDRTAWAQWSQAQRIATLACDLNEPDVAALAYELWQARGCPAGTPEEDWFAAIEQLRSGRDTSIGM
jgi:hypothetical protein